MPKCFEEETDLSTIPQLNDTDFRVLRAWDIYDGPLNGIAEYYHSAEYPEYRVWFQVHNSYLDERRRYVVYALTASEMDLFNQIVERIDSIGKENSDLSPDDPQWKYKHARWEEAKIPWEEHELVCQNPIGWFEEGQNQDFWCIWVMQRFS